MIRFRSIEHYIENRAQSRLCDGRPASDADASSEELGCLRDPRMTATLYPDCQAERIRAGLWTSTTMTYSLPVNPFNTLSARSIFE